MAEFITKAYDYMHSIFYGFYANLLAAVIILLAGFIIGKLVGKIIAKILRGLEINKIIEKATRVKGNAERFLSLFATYFIYFITIIMALNQLNITTTVLQMLSAAVIIVIIISIILAIKDFVPNVFAGIYLYRNKFIIEGEYIEVKGLRGKVVHISLVETKLETKDGDVVYIPNSVLTKTEVLKVKEKKRKKR